RVAHRELMATAPAAQQTREQRPSGVRRARLLRATHVLGDVLLDSLELLPAHVTVVSQRNQCQPLLARFASLSLARLTLGVVEAMFALAVGVCPAVGRIGQYPADRVVGRTPPAQFLTSVAHGKLHHA